MFGLGLGFCDSAAAYCTEIPKLAQIMGRVIQRRHPEHFSYNQQNISAYIAKQEMQWPNRMNNAYLYRNVSRTVVPTPRKLTIVPIQIGIPFLFGENRPFYRTSSGLKFAFSHRACDL